MRHVLGIDPGLRRTGWGVVEQQELTTSYVASGVLVIDTKETMARRLAELLERCQSLLDQWHPEHVALEEIFVHQKFENFASSLLLAQARGVVLAAVASRNIALTSYSPRTIKKCLTNRGAAPKTQVQAMVRLLLPSSPATMTDDESDALAGALCHVHHMPPASSAKRFS